MSLLLEQSYLSAWRQGMSLVLKQSSASPAELRRET